MRARCVNSVVLPIVLIVRRRAKIVSPETVWHSQSSSRCKISYIFCNDLDIYGGSSRDTLLRNVEYHIEQDQSRPE